LSDSQRRHCGRQRAGACSSQHTKLRSSTDVPLPSVYESGVWIILLSAFRLLLFDED